MNQYALGRSANPACWLARGRRVEMRRVTCLVLLSTAVAVTALHFARNVGATPAVGFAATTIVSGTFGEIDVLNKSIIPDSSENDRRAKVWLSLQKTEE